MRRPSLRCPQDQRIYSRTPRGMGAVASRSSRSPAGISVAAAAALARPSVGADCGSLQSDLGSAPSPARLGSPPLPYRERLDSPSPALDRTGSAKPLSHHSLQAAALQRPPTLARYGRGFAL